MGTTFIDDRLFLKGMDHVCFGLSCWL